MVVFTSGIVDTSVFSFLELMFGGMDGHICTLLGPEESAVVPGRESGCGLVVLVLPLPCPCVCPFVGCGGVGVGGVVV